MDLKSEVTPTWTSRQLSIGDLFAKRKLGSDERFENQVCDKPPAVGYSRVFAVARAAYAMPLTISRQCLFCCFLLSLCITGCGSESLGDTGFERAMAYSRDIQALNRSFEKTVVQSEKIAETAEQLMQSLNEAKTENDAIVAAGKLQQLVVDILDIRAAIEKSKNRRNPLNRSQTLFDGRQRPNDTARLQLLQLSSAKQLTLKRARDLAVELQTLAQEYKNLFQKANRFFSSYQELADVFGMRTRLEWQAALHQLPNPQKANLGARYLRAVTLRRLGKFEDGAAEFEQLAKLNTPVQALCHAARAECLVLAGKLREGKRLIGSISGEAAEQPGVQGYRGLIAALDEDWRTAVSAWKIDLKNGGREIGLRRNIAIGQAILSKKNSREAKRALENIQVANTLSGKREWSVHLATAIVYLALDDRPNAVAAAEESVKQSCHECMYFCEQSVEQLKQGIPPTWDFASH